MTQRNRNDCMTNVDSFAEFENIEWIQNVHRRKYRLKLSREMCQLEIELITKSETEKNARKIENTLIHWKSDFFSLSLVRVPIKRQAVNRRKILSGQNVNVFFNLSLLIYSFPAGSFLICAAAMWTAVARRWNWRQKTLRHFFLSSNSLSLIQVDYIQLCIGNWWANKIPQKCKAKNQFEMANEMTAEGNRKQRWKKSSNRWNFHSN